MGLGLHVGISGCTDVAETEIEFDCWTQQLQLHQQCFCGVEAVNLRDLAHRWSNDHGDSTSDAGMMQVVDDLQELVCSKGLPEKSRKTLRPAQLSCTWQPHIGSISQ